MSSKTSIRHSVVNKGAGGPDDSDIKQRGFYCVFLEEGGGGSTNCFNDLISEISIKVITDRRPVHV